MHPFLRVLFNSSPLLTLGILVTLAYTEGRFAPDWSKMGIASLKIATGVAYILTIISWSLAAVVLISLWILNYWLVYAFVFLVFLTAYATGAIAEKANEYGNRQRLEEATRSTTYCGN